MTLRHVLLLELMGLAIMVLLLAFGVVTYVWSERSATDYVLLSQWTHNLTGPTAKVPAGPAVPAGGMIFLSVGWFILASIVMLLSANGIPRGGDVDTLIGRAKNLLVYVPKKQRDDLELTLADIRRDVREWREEASPVSEATIWRRVFTQVVCSLVSITWSLAKQILAVVNLLRG